MIHLIFEILGWVVGVLIVWIVFRVLQDLRIAPRNLVQDVTTKHLYLDKGPPGFSRIPFFADSMYARQRKYEGVWRISNKFPIYMKAVNSNGNPREFIDFPSNFIPISHADALNAPID